MAGNGRPYPKKGWKNAHDAMPTCNDKEAMKWMSAFMKNEKPNLDKDGWMWMLHGDVGEDNLVAGVLNKEDSTPGQWIESCLLYTSPSPRDATLSRMPSSA